jgi:microcystin-dependent protein
MFAGNFAISGYAMCNGQTLGIATNQALFAIIGTTYGGNGTSTFQLPNFQGRRPVHQGQGNGLSQYDLGQTGGTEHATLTIANLPNHSHNVNAVAATGNQATVGGALLANGSKPEYYSNATSNATMNPAMIAPAGGNVPVPILQPYLAITFLIALKGTFPVRN